MEESADAQQREQLVSDDEETVEFEIEVITSSSSASSAGSRASSPTVKSERNDDTNSNSNLSSAADTATLKCGEHNQHHPSDQREACAAGGQIKERIVDETNREIQKIPSPIKASNDVVDGGERPTTLTTKHSSNEGARAQKHYQEAIKSFKIVETVESFSLTGEARSEINLTKNAGTRSSIVSREEEEEPFEEKRGRANDLFAPPARQPIKEEKIPLGRRDSFRSHGGESMHIESQFIEANRETNDGARQRQTLDSGADSNSLEDDLKQGQQQQALQSRRQNEAEAIEPAASSPPPLLSSSPPSWSPPPHRPEQPDSSNPESGAASDRESEQQQRRQQKRVGEPHDGVKATSDSGDGCQWRLVSERIQCPAGWSLIAAGSSANGRQLAAIEQVQMKAPFTVMQAKQSDSALTSQQCVELLSIDDDSADGERIRDERADTAGQMNSMVLMMRELNDPSRGETLTSCGQHAGRHVTDDVGKQEHERFGGVSLHLEEAVPPPLVVEVDTGVTKAASSSSELEAATATAITKATSDEPDDVDNEFQADSEAGRRSSSAALNIRATSSEQQHFNRLALDQLSSSSSLNMLHSQGTFEDEDLEREFDDEPEFQRRNVQLKRNKNPRDEYELGDELGRGKFGTVFRCTEQSSGLKLAAKFIHMRRREDREDVEREVAIMSVLQHKRLLQLYDAFDDGLQEMCLITELVEGGELFERIVDDDFDLTEKKAAIFMRQICEGVEYMHSEQIVHLDMKPENILCLSRTGIRIKLIDFGLARRLDPNKPIRVLFGTPDFAAPEVLAYETVNLATDMWSVGVICYVLLSGLSPFMGDTDIETMANVMRATFDFNDCAFDAISDLAKDFISRLLVRDPGARLKPSECLKHAWLQRGGGPLEAQIRERRNSCYSMVLGGHHRLALEQAAMLSSLAAATGSSGPTPPTPPSQLSAGTPSLLAGTRPRASIGGESTTSAGNLSLDKRRLKKYVVRRKWHKTVHAIMALGRMGANLKFA